MKIEVDMEVLLCLLKEEADYTRKTRKDRLPLPLEDIERDNLNGVYINGWNTGYRQGVDHVIEMLRTLVNEI